MFTRLRHGFYRVKLAIVLLSLALVTGAQSDPITKNEVEDLNILISQFVGGQPNVLTILDLSGSMGRNWGGTQVGNWDVKSTINDCEDAFGSSSDDRRARSAHCAENTANTSECGSKWCPNGVCSSEEEFNNLLNCVLDKVPGFDPSCIYDRVCGNNNGVCGETASSCDDDFERSRAAAAIEAAAGLTMCSGPTNCQVGSDRDPSCDTSSDYSRFKTCMQTLQLISKNKDDNCSGGTSDCKGEPRFGSSRLDVALSVFFNFLDADDSLASKFCDDPGKLFDGVNSSISCRDYMETPYRDVSSHVKGTGSGFKLPITNGSDTPLIDELTDNDAELLGIRFRPMTYSGAAWRGCTAGNTFQLPQGGFAGGSKQALDNVWKFYRGQTAWGGTPLAYSLGFDDSSASNSTIPNDALGAYRVELQTDPAIECRPEFVVVITDGEDTCSGECSVTPGSCSGSETTNANRRSSIQAVSNLRTYYARNPVKNRGKQFKKEILTFVIGIGIDSPQAKRTLNAMALAGGTHTTGVIKHKGPDGKEVGTVDIESVLPSGDAFGVFKDLGIAKGIDTDPVSATLAGCKTPDEDGVCQFQGINVFDNSFFETGTPFTEGQPLEGFAFFANNAEELADALKTILEFIQTFSTSGIAPTAPQSSTSVALRDRVFLSILTPVSGERLWQGRLALYGFVNDPQNPGAKMAVDVNGNVIFDEDGSLNQNAKNFHWEAGKTLAERDIASDPRNLFTVNTMDTSKIETVKTSDDQIVSIRYTGERVVFNNTFEPEVFGISDADVTDPIPDFCQENGIKDCSSLCGDTGSEECRSCVKECIRDKIVDFMKGNTNILPVGDPMGSMGTNCPDPQLGGSFATCSIRLGDIFHSVPVVVGSPSALFFDVGFQNFAKEFRDRTAVVYVGANDGFIHGFHAGNFINPLDPSLPDSSKVNPFTGEVEKVPFFNAGTGREVFGFAPPSFLPDSRAPLTKSPESPSGIIPDYRFGDFKTFIVDSQVERSFFDGSPLVADVFIDGYENGIQITESEKKVCKDIPLVDGEIDKCGREWHTVLLSGFRNGGGAYIALDVTNIKCMDENCTEVGKQKDSGPEYPQHLWTTFDKNFGNSWSDPTIGRVRMKVAGQTVDRWVMFVGGGLDPTDTDPTDGVSFGNAFYAIDIPTGKIIFKFAKDTASAPNATLTDPRMTCDVPSKVGVFDLNADGYVDIAYAGDTCGRLWRFDISKPIVADSDISQTGRDGNANITAPDWTGDIAFCATANLEQCNDPGSIPEGERQPIFFAPTVVLDDLGRRHVVFVTGNRRHPSNIAEYGKLYNFIDEFIPAFLAGGEAGSAVSAPTKTEADFTSGQIIKLVPQTGTGISDQFTTSGGAAVNNQGEFIVVFPNNADSPGGEKGFGSPVVINRVLIFATFAPDIGGSEDPCTSSAGVGRVFAIDYLTGEPALARVPGAKKLIQGNDSEKENAAGRTVAEGMPTPAQLTFGARGSVVLTMAFTGSAATGGSQFLVWELPPFPTRTQTLFWEEML
ncbi:Type IV pilus biogenesis factor PilY1 [bacterium HR37]|nr:Type IV pilus biogenesis factor PilY1 [bacterium HR37]